MRVIKIQANLSKEKEAIEIAKQILKNPILIGKNNILIGSSNIEVQELNTFLKIERVPKEPLMSICSCCDINFEKNLGKKLYVNYGGKTKLNHYCSDKCRNEVLNILPSNRASIDKKKLQTQFFF